MDGTPLDQVKSTTFLGVTINDKLTWEDHKQLVYNKICKTLGILYKCKKVMTENECIKMYKTFVEPYFFYGIEVWGHTIQSENDILVKLQCKIIRMIFGCARTQDAWKHCNGHVLTVLIPFIIMLLKNYAWSITLECYHTILVIVLCLILT